MKPQDKALANIAEAAKRVMKKETEVQPSDKDFVDLHSIDKDKRRGSTPLEEKDIDEANEFTKAAAKAAVAGDDEFEFDGKKFPTEMDVDVAKKILGESTDLDEKKYEFVSTFDKKLIKPNITTKDVIKLYPKAKFSNRNLWPGNAAEKPGGVVALEKNLAARFFFKDTDHPGKKLASNDEFTITAIWSFKSPGQPTDLFGSFYESTDLDEAFIDVDASDPKSPEFKKLLKKYRVKMKIITMKGPGGGMPLVKLSGKKKDLEGILKDPNGWQDDGFLAGFIEEANG